VVFRLTEYAAAEARFIHRTVSALSLSRGGIAAHVGREEASRVGTTQVTTGEGETVDLPSVEIAAAMRMDWDDIVAGRVEPLLVTLDEAAEEHHKQLTEYIFSTLETVTAATGNQIDAAGRPFFDSLYEMYETMEFSFEDDGSLSSGYAWVMHPDTAEVLKQREKELTDDQRRQLDELMDRKRQEYFAGRRSRKLS
jgi:hypothetical protein